MSVLPVLTTGKFSLRIYLNQNSLILFTLCPTEDWNQVRSWVEVWLLAKANQSSMSLTYLEI